MKILEDFTYVIIFIIFILIGSPLKYNCIIVNYVLIALETGIIIYKIIKKEKINIEKIDIYFLILYGSTFIPLIFGTYLSLIETLEEIIINISLLDFYFIIKEIVNKNNKSAENLQYVIIVGGILLSIIGIDELTSQNLRQIGNFLNIPNVQNYENRMQSAFGYTNSFAIFMAICLFLTIQEIGTKNKKNEYILGLTFIFMSSLLLSYSRAVILITLLIGILYLIFLDKNKRINTIYMLALNVILVLIYAKIFEKLQEKQIYVFIYLVAIIGYIFSSFIPKILNKYHEKIEKVKPKTYFLIIFILIILFIILYIVGLRLEKTVVLFGENDSTNSVRYDIYNVEKNKEYTYLFDIESESTLKSDTNYSITIAEENKYYDTVEEHKINFGNYTGTKEIKFTTSNDTIHIVIYVESNNSKTQKGLKINSLKINDKKHVLNYLYLPQKLVGKIQSLFSKEKSIWERFVFINDGLKIAQKNLLFGYGGRSWNNIYKYVQQYRYETKEVHSYIIQILIDNGIISVIGLILILIYFAKIVIKKHNYSATVCSFIILTLHSMIDFDMSFYSIMIVWVILFVISVNQNKETDDKNLPKKLNTVVISIILILNISTSIVGIEKYKTEKDIEEYKKQMQITLNNKEYSKTVEELAKLKRIEKYENGYDILNQIDYSNIETEQIEQIYEEISEKNIIYDIRTNILRNLAIEKIMLTCKNNELVLKFAKIINDENEQMTQYIEDKEKNRLSEIEINQYAKIQKQIYDEAINLINKSQ